MADKIEAAWDIAPYRTPITHTSTEYRILNDDGVTSTVIIGTGFTYNGSNVPTGGTITSVNHVIQNGGGVFTTITNLHVSMADYGTLLSSFISLRNQITWAAGITDGNAIEFASTRIRINNGDGTFTDINGTGLAENGPTLTGTVSSITHVAANGATILGTVTVPNITLDAAAGALIESEAGQQLYKLLNFGDNTITGVPTGPLFSGSTEVTTGIWLGPGNDTVIGSASNNFINYGDSATSGVVVNLLAGTATGGGGNDTLIGIHGVSGSKFDDTIIGSNYNSNAGEGERLDGNDGNDTINAGTGNDRLEGGQGNDTLNGGAGNDTAFYGNDDGLTVGVTVSLAIAGAQNTIGAGTDTLINIENLEGSPFNDTLTGNAGANVLTGDDGNDILDGGAGADTMIGGAGNDTFIVDNLGDRIFENPGEGIDTVVTTLTNVTLASYANVESLIYSGAGAFIGLGDAGANTVNGGAGNDYFYTYGGDDVVSGGAGIDVFILGDGNDTASGGDDQDYFYGGDGNDTLNGDGGVDVLIGEAGNDTGNGGDGGDYFYLGDGDDVANGGAGNDIFVLTAGNDTASGDDGQDYFYMGDGDDVMNGGAGVDVMLGEAGNDTFNGGLGVDYLFLGPQGAGDNDTVIVDKVNTGVQVVFNFEAGGANDVVRLVGSGLTSFAQVQANISDFTASGGFCILTLDADTSVWFIGVAPNQLTSADFVFA